MALRIPCPLSVPFKLISRTSQRVIQSDTMKYLVVFAIVACTISFSECITEDMREKILQQMTMQCGKKEGASDDDVNGILAFKPTNTRGSKCVQACLGEASGVIKEKHVDPEAAAAIASLAYNGDDTRIAQAREIASGCVGITDDDRCDAVFKIFECGMEVAKSKGYVNGLL